MNDTTKSELRPRPHHLLPGVTVVEVWWRGRFIAEVTGADGPGVRVISKHARTIKAASPLTTEVLIDVDEKA